MEIEKLGEKVADFAIPVIIVGMLLGSIITMGGQAATFANTILDGLTTAVTTYWPLYVGMAFLFAIMTLYYHSKHGDGKK